MKIAPYIWELDQTVGCRENPGYVMRGNMLLRCEVCKEIPGVTRVTVPEGGRMYMRGGSSHVYGTLRSVMCKISKISK